MERSIRGFLFDEIRKNVSVWERWRESFSVRSYEKSSSDHRSQSTSFSCSEQPYLLMRHTVCICRMAWKPSRYDRVRVGRAVASPSLFLLMV
jgi:hypothetical protein